jgi:hypothetical protein
MVIMTIMGGGAIGAGGIYSSLLCDLGTGGQVQNDVDVR